MKKISAFLILSLAAVSFAGAKGLESLKTGFSTAADFEKAAEIKVPAPRPAAAEKISARKDAQQTVQQDLEYKLNNIAWRLRDLRNDVTWLDNDLRNLESRARRIESSNQQDHFFENDLRRMSYNLNNYANTAARLLMDVRNFLSIAVKSEKLNKIARDMEWDARDMWNDAQFQVENAARNLKWTVDRVKPEIIGYQAKWYAYDIERYSRDYSWKTRDLYYAVQDLIDRTRP